MAAEGASGARGASAVGRCRLVAAAAGSVATAAVAPVVVALVGQDDTLEIAPIADIGLPEDIRGMELHRAHGQVPLGGDGRIALMLQDELGNGHLLGREAQTVQLSLDLLGTGDAAHLLRAQASLPQGQHHAECRQGAGRCQGSEHEGRLVEVRRRWRSGGERNGSADEHES